MTRPHAKRRPTNALAILALLAVVGSAGWMFLVASHNPGGFFGESAAAWAQAIMSVGAILVAIVIDQGASRRDRQDRLDAAAQARAARVGVLRLAAFALNNAADTAAFRPLKRGQRFEGLAFDAVLSMQQTVRHFVDRGSDSDPILVWVLNSAAREVDAAATALNGRRLANKADLLALQLEARRRAQALRELLDEYEAGLFE